MKFLHKAKCSQILRSISAWAAAMIGYAVAQTAPAPQGLPYFQNFGTVAFSTLPAGVSAWNGLNGANTDTQAKAETSTPTGNATLTTATTAQSGGGCYGYATGGNARFYIQTSSNATNGVNQLAIAINTSGWSAITLGYDIEIISAQPRTIGVICQYRIGSSGAWTSLTPAAGNPFSQAGGTTGVKASVSVQLPPNANNQPVVQIRWALWRGNQSGNSSGLAIDNIAVTATAVDPWAPPSGYYAAAEGLTGASLKPALQSITSTGHTPVPYAGNFNRLRAIYEDPANTNNVLTVYSGTSINKFDVYFPGGDLGPDVSWDREHLWPVSYGLNPNGSEGPAYGDLFNLRPAISSVNSLRGNLYFDNSSGTITVPALAPQCSYDNNSWQPRDSEKGDIARAMFYMATRYDGSDPGTIDLELSNSPSSSIGRFAKLSTLLLWHQQDPVSDAERQQNQVIFSAHQNNRNPFVDRPEFVGLMWGNILLDKTTATVTEGGAGDSYTLTLTSEPEADVNIQISSAPGGRVVLSSSNLTFTRQNWNLPQTITLSAVDDMIFNSTPLVTLSHTITTTDPWFASLALDPVMVTVIDDDPLITPASLPLAFGGPWSPLPSAGFLGEGLGTYADSLGGDSAAGSAKFDSSNDRLTIAFNAAPATLNYHLKANTSGPSVPSEGQFQILQSVDGINFTLVRQVTNKSTADELFSDALNPASRFVRFLYQQKVTGNIQLDNILITAQAQLTPWQSWLTFYSLSGPDTSPTADPDADGYSNLAEYALGRSPVAADAEQLVPLVEKVSGKLRITAVLRITDSALTSRAETTTDLNDSGSWNGIGITRSVAADQSAVPAGFERTIFEIDDAGAPQRFARLAFELAEN